MKIQELPAASADALVALKKALVVREGSLKITVNTFKKVFAEFLGKYYFEQGQVLQIDDAVIEDRSDEGVLSVTGTASFINIPDMPVAAEFSAEDSGEMAVFIFISVACLIIGVLLFFFIKKLKALTHGAEELS